MEDVAKEFASALQSMLLTVKTRDYNAMIKTWNDAETLRRHLHEVYIGMFQKSDEFINKHGISGLFDKATLKNTSWQDDVWGRLMTCPDRDPPLMNLKQKLDVKAVKIVAEYAAVALDVLDKKDKNVDNVKKSLSRFWQYRDQELNDVLKKCVNAEIKFKSFPDVKNVEAYVEELDSLQKSGAATILIVNVNTNVRTETNKDAKDVRTISTLVDNPKIHVAPWDSKLLRLMRDGPKNVIKLRSIVFVLTQQGNNKLQVHASEFDSQLTAFTPNIKVFDEKNTLAFSSKIILEDLYANIGDNSDNKSGTFFSFFKFNKATDAHLKTFMAPFNVLQHTFVFDVKGNVVDNYKDRKVGNTLVLPYLIDNLISAKVINDIIIDIKNGETLTRKMLMGQSRRNTEYITYAVTNSKTPVSCSVVFNDPNSTRTKSKFKEVIQHLAFGANVSTI